VLQQQMREHNTTERALAHAKEIKHKIRDMHKQQKRNTKTKKKTQGVQRRRQKQKQSAGNPRDDVDPEK